MNRHPLHDATQKAGWAGEHLSWLAEEINKFLTQKIDTLTGEIDPATGQPTYSVTTTGPKRYWPGDWATVDRPMLIGDFAYNIRAALDHIAFQLVRLNGIDIPDRVVEFPISRTAKHYFDKNGGQRKIRQITKEEHRAAILESQPFKQAEAQGIDVIHEPLWMLSELRNIDTHRELHTVKMELQVPNPADPAVMDVIRDYPEVFTAPFQTNLPARVVFDEPTCPSLHGKDVLPTLYEISRGVSRVFDRVRQFFP